MTPFHSDKVTIDFNGIKNIIEFFIKEGIQGIWVLGTGSEDYLLTFQQRYEVIRFVSKEFSGQIKIFAGISFLSFQESLLFLDQMNNLDLAGIHYINYNNLIGEKLIYDLYLKISQLSKHSVWLYSSANWGKKLSFSFINEISKLPNIKGCKYSTSNIVEMEKIISLQTEEFKVMPAVVKSLIGCLSMGAKSATTVEACAHLEKIIPIYKNFENGNFEEALNSQLRLNRHLESLETKVGKENFVKSAEIKSILHHLNFCERYTAKGLIDLNELEYHKLISIEEKWI